MLLLLASIWMGGPAGLGQVQPRLWGVWIGGPQTRVEHSMRIFTADEGRASFAGFGREGRPSRHPRGHSAHIPLSRSTPTPQRSDTLAPLHLSRDSRRRPRGGGPCAVAARSASRLPLLPPVLLHPVLLLHPLALRSFSSFLPPVWGQSWMKYEHSCNLRCDYQCCLFGWMNKMRIVN